MLRLDVRPDESGCDLIWENEVRSSAVPKLSTADELLYTVERQDFSYDSSIGILDSFYFTVLDPYTGAILRQDNIGMGVLNDTLQMAGTVGDAGVYWQGSSVGITRVK